MTFEFSHQSRAPSQQAKLWAKRLLELARKHNRVGPGAYKYLDQWARKLQPLAKSKGVEEVNRVLAWYIANCDQEYVPQAYTADFFVSKFEQLVRIIDNTCSDNEQVSEVNQRLAEKLANVALPPEILAHLPVLVQRTSDRWKAFLAKANSFKSKCDLRDSDFIYQMAAIYGPTFVELWFNFLITKFGYLEHYTGAVLGLAFKPDSIGFKESFWRQWSNIWTSSPRTFDKLLTRILEWKTEDPGGEG